MLLNELEIYFVYIKPKLRVARVVSNQKINKNKKKYCHSVED